MLKAYRIIWIESAALCLVIATSLVCYPGLIIQSNLTIIKNESWLQVTFIAFYTVSDVIGRYATTPFKVGPRKRFLVTISILRIAFIYTSLMIGLRREP